MKTLEMVRKEYTQCPEGHKKNFAFSSWTIYCKECDANYDIEMRK